jgi:hypothetical protein
VTKGAVPEKKLEKTMTDATFAETVTVHTLADEAELVRAKMQQERDAELEQLRKGSKVKDGKLANEALLSGTLEAQSHPGWQEANARKTLMGMEQERVATPSTCTVQAPHWATPHPYFVPVSPICSRIAQSNGVSGSASTSTVRPFTFSFIILRLPCGSCEK